jgi:hypothetical protein
MEDLKQRIIELERRVALLEGGGNGASKSSLPEAPNVNRSTSLVQVEVSNKRFAPKNPHYGEYEDHIWFDITYVAGTIVKPARALKGVLCFADIFGEVKFRINVTVNERLDPAHPLHQEGIGFTYNQFMPEHQWMLTTLEADMKISFLTTNVIYADGTSEEFR